MSEPSLNGLLETVWTQIAEGPRDRNHPARHPVLATIGADGPEARTLVLRAVDREQQSLEFHTDTASPKVAQIADDARVALHFWIPAAQLQIRMRAQAAVSDGDQDLYQSLPPQAQQNYLGPIPGTPLSAPSQTFEWPRFSRLTCVVSRIDALLLDAPHRRAVFDAPDWQGAWVAP